jgi:hypothetical protein
LLTHITKINLIEGIDKLWVASDTSQQRKSKVKAYLKDLLALAKAFATGAQIDPHNLPVYLMGTAGLRDFKGRVSNDNYVALQTAIEECIKEKFPKVEYCDIITGEFEGVYGWVAANYTLGAFSGNPDTVGYLELGGASAQIAFRPHKNLGEGQPYEGEVTHVCVGTSDFFLYVKSYPLGANKAWDHHDSTLREALEDGDVEVCGQAIQMLIWLISHRSRIVPGHMGLRKNTTTSHSRALLCGRNPWRD